jgi:hypothetical protein
MPERIQCKTPGCNATILRSTVERTGGFCMPCVQRKARAERDAFIKANRREIDPYEGITDPVEVLRIMHQPFTYDPLIIRKPYQRNVEEVCAAMGDSEKNRLVQFLYSAVGTEFQRTAAEIAVSLRRASEYPMDVFLDALIKRGELYPGFMFLGARPEIRDSIFRRMDERLESLSLNHALVALAWIGDQAVVEQFARWRDDPPAWANKLFIPPHRYAHEAGWEVTTDNRRRELCLSQCYQLLRRSSADTQASTVEVVVDAPEICPWCGRRLIYLLEIDRTSPFSLPGRARILTCDSCSCFSEGLLAEHVFDERPIWSAANQKCNFLPAEASRWPRLPVKALKLASTPRRPYLTCHYGGGRGGSQIGGHPSWVQDAFYPVCPACRQTMCFLGQVEICDLVDFAEGTRYAFFCQDCGTCGTSYQQT